jgi:hypothetical protein
VHWQEELGRRLTRALGDAYRRWEKPGARDLVPDRDAVRRIALVALGFTAAGCLVAAEFSTIARTEILEAGCDALAGRSLADGCNATGGERHGYTLVVLAIIAAAMAWGAGRRNSRPAAAVLAGVGAIAMVIALIVDAPTLNDTGTLGQLFTDVETHVGTGFWLELAGAVGAVAAGALGLGGRRRPAPAVAASVESVAIGNGLPADDADAVLTRARVPG